MNDQRELMAFVSLFTIAAVLLLAIWYRDNGVRVAAKLSGLPKQGANAAAPAPQPPGVPYEQSPIPVVQEDWVTG